MSKHTPTPWRIERKEYYGRQVIARLSGSSSGFPAIVVDFPRVVTEEERAGNMALFLASPDLLASLKETREAAAALMRAIVASGHTDDVMRHVPSTWEGFGMRADAAIAKAEDVTP